MANESYGNVGASNLTRGGGLSTFQNTTSDLIEVAMANANTINFYLYKDGGSTFIFGGSNNANLSGFIGLGILNISAL